MRTSAIALIAASALAIGFSGSVRAEPQIAATEEIEITARALPNFAPVAVTGKVAGIDNGALLLQRADGLVKADIRNKMVAADDSWDRPELLTAQFRRGDEVTVFRHLQKNRDLISVEPDSIYLPTSATTATLYMLEVPKLESVRMLNFQPSVRSALHHYRANYRAL